MGPRVVPFVTSLMADHARQIKDGRVPDDDGTVEVHAAATQRLLHTSRARSIGTDVQEPIANLLERAAATGHGSSGIAGVIETITKGERNA
ncbi:hypothetical protein [Streptomyces narbonensis]|uniref:imine reductase family protein n=1 Tax=Streptomyces narbonensis TaxID=67333 RepID=UPI00340BD074